MPAAASLYTASQGSITLDGNATTANITDAGSGSADDISTGAISLTAATGISGAAKLITGNASVDAVGGGGIDSATSGAINLDVTGTGDITLSSAEALTVGSATVLNAVGDDDTTTTGNITITSADQVEAAGSTAVHVKFGAASGGFSNNDGDLSVTTDGVGAAGDLRIASTGAFDVTALNASAGGDVELRSGGNAGITIGGTSGSTLGLSAIELGNITSTGTVILGGTSEGNIVFAGSVDLLAASFDELHLKTGGTITDSSGIRIDRLAITAVGSVTLDGADNDVDQLAASVTGSGNTFQFVDIDSVEITTVDGVAGIDTKGGAITLNAATGISGAGDIDSVDSDPAASAAAVTIGVTGAGDVNLSGAINAYGSKASAGVGGSGDVVTITTSTGSVTVGVIDTSGGDAYGGTYAGGAAGAISIDADGGGITLSGALTTTGGAGYGGGGGGRPAPTRRSRSTPRAVSTSTAASRPAPTLSISRRAARSPRAPARSPPTA